MRYYDSSFIKIYFLIIDEALKPVNNSLIPTEKKESVLILMASLLQLQTGYEFTYK